MPIPEKLVTSNEVGEFTETVEFAVLSCGNVENNNNKYYCLELQKSHKGEFRLFCTRGRIGATLVYGVRGPVFDPHIAKSEFDKIVNSKCKGKAGGEVSKYLKVETLKPTVGSKNICNVQADKKLNIKVDLSSRIRTVFGVDETKLIQQLYDENIHQITNTTTISVSTTTGGLETALGPVTPEHVRDARSILEELRKLHDKGRLLFGDQSAKQFNNQYLSMIPRKVSRTITEEEMVLSDKKLVEEFDLLDQLEAAVKINTTTPKNTTFKFGFNLVKTPAELKRVSEWFEKSRASNHGALRYWRVSNVYDVIIDSDRGRFDSNKLQGSVETLWHGSRNCNILSILMNGLMIPRHNAPHVTGRMFGNGVYAANNSTKALNYSVGYWSGTKNRYPNAFLCVVDFKMGKVYHPTKSMFNSAGPPSGYDSTHARAKDANLYNDEYIVYNLNQQRVLHLVELSER